MNKLLIFIYILYLHVLLVDNVLFAQNLKNKTYSNYIEIPENIIPSQQIQYLYEHLSQRHRMEHLHTKIAVAPTDSLPIEEAAVNYWRAWSDRDSNAALVYLDNNLEKGLVYLEGSFQNIGKTNFNFVMSCLAENRDSCGFYQAHALTSLVDFIAIFPITTADDFELPSQFDINSGSVVVKFMQRPRVQPPPGVINEPEYKYTSNYIILGVLLLLFFAIILLGRRRRKNNPPPSF